MRRQLLAFVLLFAQLAVGAVAQAQTLSHVRITPPSVPAGERVALFPFTVRESATAGILVSAVTDGRLRETAAGVVPHRAYSDSRTYPRDTKYVRVWVEVLAPTTTDRTFTVRAAPPLSVPPKVVMKAGQKKVSFVVTIGANAVGDKQLLVDNAKNQSTRVDFTLLP